MFDLAIIHRPGMIDGKHDVGRILEAMLYYDRVHLMMSAQMFTGLWDILGPDDLFSLVTFPSVTTTLTSQALAISNNIGPFFTTHRPVAIKVSGRAGKLIDQKDDVGSLLQMIGGLANRPGGTWAQVNRIVAKTKRSRYEKILGGEAESRLRVLSLIKDEATIKLFLKAWAFAQGKQINESALGQARISTTELGEEFTISSTVALEQMVPSWNRQQTWGEVLGTVQDYAVDLYLSQAHSADIVAQPAVAEIASNRLDISLQRALNNEDQISAFEEMVFDDAHAFAAAINKGNITFAEALKVIEQSRKFRTWTKGIAPDANLIAEYHRAISKETILSRLPASILRFTIFSGLGLAADSVAPGGSTLTSAFDTFVVERLFRGWRPNIFVRNMTKTLELARTRDEERWRR